MIAVPVAGTAGTAIVWFLLRDPVWAFGLGTLWFGAGGVYLAVRLMRNVTFDEPLSYQRRLVRGEFSSQFSRPVGPRRISVEFAVPQIDYLSPAVCRSMDWDVSDQRPILTGVTEPTNTAAANPYLSSAPITPTTPDDPVISETSTAANHQRPVNPYLTSSRS